MADTDFSTKLSTAFAQVGTDVKGILANIGDLSQLTTTQKATLVVALNELKKGLGDLQTSIEEKSQIDDSVTALTSTWSSTKINSQIEAAVNGLINGAPDALNTLKELADAMQTNADAIAALQDIAAGHVKYDAAQSLTAEQQAQARANIDAVSSAQLAAVETKAQKGIDDAAAAQTTANEAKSAAGTNATNIGTLSTLSTDAKSNLVAAINEVASEAAAAQAQADKGVSDAAAAKAAADAAKTQADKGVADAAAAKSAADKAQGDIDAFKLAVGDTTTDFAAAYVAARDAA